MAKPTSRKQFKEYILRKLGAPVIQINLSDDQIDDRIDEAISFWNDYHYNGSQHVYLKHQITQEDIDNGYILAPEGLLGVSRIFSLNSSIGTGSGMFNITYQFVLNNIQDLTGYTIQNYYMTMQHLQFIQEWLVGQNMIRYNKHSNRIYLDIAKSKLTAGNYLIIEAYDVLDEVENADMWNDRWLQNYAAVLVQEAWGNVLTKYTNYQLVGGVQFNGQEILQNAKEERRTMEEEAKNSLQPLVFNYIG